MKVKLISSSSMPNINKSKIALDTNILLWTFYERISNSTGYQKHIYPSFVSILLQEGYNNKLYTSIYNILEAFSVIETTEYEIYLEENNLTKNNFSKKDFRLIDSERTRIKSILNLFFEQVINTIEIVENQILKDDLIEFYDTYTEQFLDANDFAFIKICNQNNFNYLLTDDADFKTYKSDCNFTLITGNAHVIAL